MPDASRGHCFVPTFVINISDTKDSYWDDFFFFLDYCIDARFLCRNSSTEYIRTMWQAAKQRQLLRSHALRNTTFWPSDQDVALTQPLGPRWSCDLFFLIEWDRRQGVPVPGPDLTGLCTLLWFSASSRHSTNFRQPLADHRPTKKPNWDQTNCPAELSLHCQPVGLSFEVSFEVDGEAASTDQYILRTNHWVLSVPPELNMLFRDIWTKIKKTKSKIKSSLNQNENLLKGEKNNTHPIPNESSETVHNYMINCTYWSPEKADASKWKKAAYFSYLDVIWFLPTWIPPTAKFSSGEKLASNYIMNND